MRFVCTACRRHAFEVQEVPGDSIHPDTQVRADCPRCGFRTIHRPSPRQPPAGDDLKDDV